jgi:NCAIR mutase (PurE)-related protein
MHLRGILQQLASGVLSLEAAERLVEQAATPTVVADLGYAQVDLHRQERCGFPEVVFAQGKTPEHLEGVVRELHAAGQDCLATRLDPTQAEHLERLFPQAELDRVGRTFWLPASTAPRELLGQVAVVTAGTADLPVAREAAATAKALGCQVDLLCDVGVAGVHRVLRQVERLRQADVIIVLAGMEGALPSVVGGLVDLPVIAVPTSVGYGASFAGLAALLGMLNSCAANVTVVNIDAGFKAGYVAGLMVRRMARRR